MEQKDPAVLFYIDKWLVSTAEMDADCRGWYLNLILHQYNQTSIPNDIEKLAVLANVKFSEFDRFKQVFEQVLKHKFEQNSEGRLENPFAKIIIQGRNAFKEKRSNSGKISYSLKWLKINDSVKYYNTGFIKYFKNKVDFTDIDIKKEQVLKHLFKHLFELYINTNTNVNTNKNTVGMEEEKVSSDRPSISTVSCELNDELNNHLTQIELNQKQEYESSKSK